MTDLVMVQLLLIFSMNFFMVHGSISCLDENNDPVDWFVIYKIPKIKSDTNSYIEDGVAFAFTSSDNQQGWVLSEKSVNDTKSIPGLTLDSFYGTSSKEFSKETLYIFYNDQPPNGTVSLTGGHTKGVVAADANGGFWLVHSVPHYPPPPGSEAYSYPHTGLKNGQSYLCITLKPDQLEIVGTQLMYNEPKIFASFIPTHLEKQYPTLEKAAIGSHVTCPPYYHSEVITSAQGTVFHSFAKTPQFNKELGEVKPGSYEPHPLRPTVHVDVIDLYSDWVAEALKVDLLVETWPNGAGRLNSSCDHPYSVENVESINLTVVGEPFPSTKDHSKWAVSELQNQPWVCIGDINRATTQAERGGGTVCLNDPQLWRAYFSSVSSVQGCPSPSVTIV